MNAALFEYQAVDKTGQKRGGLQPAASKVEAFRSLTSQGLTPLWIKPARQLGGKKGGVKTKDIAHFTYQFGVLIAALIPISEGLKSIAAQERDARFRAIILDIAARIESGEQVAQAMDRHRSVFGDMYIESVRAAEKTGNLTKVLELLSETMERNLETMRQVKGALMYPACVISVLGLAVTFLLGFVVPKFADMFAKRGMDLPVFTRVLMAVGKSVQQYWFVYIGLAALAVIAFRRAWRSPRGREALDRIFHKIPYINQILIGLAISRFCRIFSVSLSSGLGLIEALELAGRSSSRPMLMIDVRRMIEQVKVGGRLSQVLGTCTYLSPFTRRMLAAGEESAELSKMCSVVARHYDRETAYLTKNIGTFIEPILIVFIAVVVLMVALAIFLPMWDMVKLVG